MQEKRFIATKELGKLVKWLRILGYDSAYSDRKDEPGVVIQALREKRTILARSPEMAKHKGVRVIVVKHDLVEDQLDQVVKELALKVEEEGLFTRCVECGDLLTEATKESVMGKVPAYVFETHDRFKNCAACGKIYWKGTHWDMVGHWLAKKGIKRGQEM